MRAASESFDIDAYIDRAVESTNSAFTIMGDTGDITPEAKRQTRERLKAFPDVCLRAQETDGDEKLLLDFEIRDVKRALKSISCKPFYRIIPDLYFHSLSHREVSFRENCDISTIRRNESRFLGDLALRLYGVRARWRTSNL